jgi:hypothetical protein
MMKCVKNVDKPLYGTTECVMGGYIPIILKKMSNCIKSVKKMERSRAYTRSQKRRAENRAKKFLSLLGMEPTDRQIHLYAENRKPCSCGICRNEKWRDSRKKKELFGRLVKQHHDSSTHYYYQRNSDIAHLEGTVKVTNYV